MLLITFTAALVASEGKEAYHEDNSYDRPEAASVEASQDSPWAQGTAAITSENPPEELLDAAPTLAPAGVAPPGPGAARDVEAAICAQPWPCAEALAVAWCESRFDPRAVDPWGESWGLFQIHELSWRRYFGEARWSQVLEADENIRMAVEIYERAGRTWGPWSCKP